MCEREEQKRAPWEGENKYQADRRFRLIQETREPKADDVMLQPSSVNHPILPILFMSSSVFSSVTSNSEISIVFP